MSQPTADLLSIREQPIPMSYTDYLALPEPTHAEWVRGEVIIFMPPTTRHQDILLFLAVLMRLFAETLRAGKVLVAPVEMRLIAGQLSREPDIVFVSEANQQRITAARIEGPADLVVELVSPHSTTRDYHEKYHEYAQAGIREYWLIDPRPDHEQVTCYQLDPQGAYQPAPPDAHGRLHSAVLTGFWIYPAWLWQQPLPDALQTIQTILATGEGAL